MSVLFSTRVAPMTDNGAVKMHTFVSLFLQYTCYTHTRPQFKARHAELHCDDDTGVTPSTTIRQCRRQPSTSQTQPSPTSSPDSTAPTR